MVSTFDAFPKSIAAIGGLDEYTETTVFHKVDRLIGRLGFTEDDRDDLQQDLALYLIQGLKHFDPSRARRSTFITRCIEHRIADIIRHRHRARRDTRRSFRFSTDDDGEAQISATALADTASDRERERADIRIDVSSVIATLPARLVTICELLPTHSPFAISRKLGVSKQSVYRDRDAIRAAFAAAGLMVYVCGGKPRAPAA